MTIVRSLAIAFAAVVFVLSACGESSEAKEQRLAKQKQDSINQMELAKRDSIRKFGFDKDTMFQKMLKSGSPVAKGIKKFGMDKDPEFHEKLNKRIEFTRDSVEKERAKQRND